VNMVVPTAGNLVFSVGVRSVIIVITIKLHY
jgi:hypothetical protein